MESKTLFWITFAAVFLFGVSTGFWLRGLRPVKQAEPIVHTDTLWRYDTLTIEKPVPKTRWKHDTTYLALTDTAFIHHHDTTFIPIPRETTYYQDKEYEAWVTGFNTAIDSIKVFPKTAIVEVPVYPKPKRWGVGLQVGGTYLPKVGPTPYVGIGISYNLLTF